MRKSVTMLLAMVLLCLSGCGQQVQRPMRIGTNLWPGYEPLYLAQRQQLWFTDEIKLLEYPSSSEVIRAFRNKSLDAAALTLDEVLTLNQDEIQADVVLVLDVSNGADVIMAKPEIDSIKALKGRRVGIENAALGAYVISRALMLNQMQLSDIEVVPVDVSEHEAAFKSGSVDAVVTFEPVRTKLLDFGAKEIFNSQAIPGEIVDVLVVRREYLLAHPTRLKKLTRGWFKAVNYMAKSPQDAAKLIAKRLKIEPAQVLESYEGLMLADKSINQTMLGESGTLNQTLNQLGQTMIEIHLLQALPPLEGVVNGGFIE